MGIVYSQMGHLDKAIECYEKSLDLDSNNDMAYINLGVFYVKKQSPQKAITALERAIYLNPGEPRAYANAAIAYAMIGQFEDAESYLKQAVTLGHKKWRKTRVHINNLRDLAQNIEIKLPSNCPNCNAPMNVSNVIQTNPYFTCSYCGVNIT